MGDWDFTHPARAKEYGDKNLQELYDAYFNLVWEVCRSKLFDIMGHVDIIKKFGYILPEKEMEAYYRETARVFKQTGTCFENMNRDTGESFLGRCLEICLRGRQLLCVPCGQIGRYFLRR